MAKSDGVQRSSIQLREPPQTCATYTSALHLGLIAMTIVFSLILISVATVNSALAQTGKPLHQVGQLSGWMASGDGRDKPLVQAPSSPSIVTDNNTNIGALYLSHTVAGRSVVASLLILMLVLMLGITRQMWSDLERVARSPNK